MHYPMYIVCLQLKSDTAPQISGITLSQAASVIAQIAKQIQVHETSENSVVIPEED